MEVPTIHRLNEGSTAYNMHICVQKSSWHGFHHSHAVAALKMFVQVYIYSSS